MWSREFKWTLKKYPFSFHLSNTQAWNSLTATVTTSLSKTLWELIWSYLDSHVLCYETGQIKKNWDSEIDRGSYLEKVHVYDIVLTFIPIGNDHIALTNLIVEI